MKIRYKGMVIQTERKFFDKTPYTKLSIGSNYIIMGPICKKRKDARKWCLNILLEGKV